MFNSDLMGCVSAGNGGNSLAYSVGGGKSEICSDRENDIRLRRIQLSLQAKGFPNDSLNPVPFHRPSDLSVYANPDSAVTICICTADQSEPLAVQSFPLTINPFKFPALTDQGMF